METTRLSTKGQVVLPKVVRDARSWSPGTKFAVETVADGVLLRPLSPFPPTRVKDVFGCLAYRGKPKTVAEMEKAIAKAVKERRARGRY